MIIDGDIEFDYFTLNSNIVCNGNIISGIFKGDVENNGTITVGTFFGKVTGNGTIADSATLNVNFDLDGGTGTTLQKVLRGQKLTEPTTKPNKQNNSKNTKDKTDKTDKNSLSAGAKKKPMQIQTITKNLHSRATHQYLHQSLAQAQD